MIEVSPIESIGIVDRMEFIKDRYVMVPEMEVPMQIARVTFKTNDGKETKHCFYSKDDEIFYEGVALESFVPPAYTIRTYCEYQEEECAMKMNKRFLQNSGATFENVAEGSDGT